MRDQSLGQLISPPSLCQPPPPPHPPSKQKHNKPFLNHRRSHHPSQSKTEICAHGEGKMPGASWQSRDTSGWGSSKMRTLSRWHHERAHQLVQCLNLPPTQRVDSPPTHPRVEVQPDSYPIQGGGKERTAKHCLRDTNNHGTELATKAVRQARLELSGGSTPDQLKPRVEESLTRRRSSPHWKCQPAYSRGLSAPSLCGPKSPLHLAISVSLSPVHLCSAPVPFSSLSLSSCPHALCVALLMICGSIAPATGLHKAA